MAGEVILDEILDMSMFDTSVTEQDTEVEVPKSKEDIIIDNVVDDVSQEVVDNQEDEENPKVDEKTTNSPADSDEVIHRLADFLKEEGFFSTLDKEIKTVEDLSAAFQEEVKKNEFARLNEKQKAYLEALSHDVPEEIFNQHLTDVQILEGITDSVLEQDPNVCKNLIIQEAILKGDSRERAEKKYQRSYDIGDSIEDAKFAKEFLLQKTNEKYQEELKFAEQEKIKREEVANKQIEALKDAVYSTDMLFGTFKINDGFKNKVYETMTKVVDYTTNERGEQIPLNKLMKHRLEDPIGFEKSLYSIYELTDGFKNINKFNVKSTTVAAKKLRDAVQNSTITNFNGSTKAHDPEEYSAPIVDV